MTALSAILVSDDIVQQLLLAAITMMFLHFFEEFGYPGGFPLMGMKVLMDNAELDSSKWDCNNLSSMFGNWGFLFFIYILALLLPEIKFLTLSAMMFLFAEVFMHLLLFNVKMKIFYNPGLVTAVFGMGPIGVYYFSTVFDASLYVWSDYASAVAWFVAVFLFSFRSKLYWQLGRKAGYALTDQSAYGLYQNQLSKQH